ncbi:hypothetical protein EWB00_005139 [Schistosoma japonicum]|uniref:Uncharacterized protein n=1 Tax=Schistosoma japonicum TaxID=6182 RepID=A0A4Z2D2U7_SCHJA|nr:hypothetical protein EWB00_005139 [Schistosoma japonicum]
MGKGVCEFLLNELTKGSSTLHDGPTLAKQPSKTSDGRSLRHSIGFLSAGHLQLYQMSFREPQQTFKISELASSDLHF